MKNVIYVRCVEEAFTIPNEILLKADLIAIVKNPIIEELLAEARKNAPIIEIECSDEMK